MAVISIAQIRAARAMLGWSQPALAEAAGLSVPTIKRAEADQGIKVSEAAREAIRRAIEKAGVEFTNHDQPGVRLRKRKRSRSPRPRFAARSPDRRLPRP